MQGQSSPVHVKDPYTGSMCFLSHPLSMFGTLNLITSIPGPSILTLKYHHAFKEIKHW